ncbi:MAG: RnfABCDGE type electron transport complex subunit G [Calditrichaceae bacterium]|jgi:Na+-translocating ferredoxin:NAD+ oxidoreductase subunit G
MAKEESALKVIIVLVLIAFFSAFLLAYVNKVTSGPIEENKRAETKKAVGIVLNGLENYTFPEEPVKAQIDNSPAEYFPAKSEDGSIIGYAIIVKAPNGFSGDFDLMVGVSAGGKVIDTYVLEHKETPGLGDNMRKEGFKSQFRGRTLDNTNWQVTKDGGDIDALTAATITSRAFTAGVKRALMLFKKLKEEGNV